MDRSDAAAWADRNEPRRNADIDWDEFDSRSYLAQNYRAVRDDDRRILRLVRDFLVDQWVSRRATPESAALGPVVAFDAGTGTNLYPVLAMLPFADTITVFERSAANVRWLTEQRASYDSTWNQFWDILREHPTYRQVADPRRMFREKVTICSGDVYGLSEHRYDLGTMFFVAESISADHDDFEAALGAFFGALRPGSPFAAAFMENSTGYRVGQRWFPAVTVGRDALGELLAAAADDLRLWPIGSGRSGALRPGYTGMLLALGRVRP